MSDPIAALESLPPESPPREVVLSSLRLFRYRAIATIALAGALVLALALIVREAQPSSIDSEVRKVIEDPGASFRLASGSTTIGMIRVTVTEVASSDEGNAVRLLFEDLGTPERIVDLDLLSVSQGGVEVGPVVSIQSLGRNAGRDSTAAWVALDESLDPFGADIEILVLPIPDAILDEGGVISSDAGLAGVVTIERTNGP